MNVDRSDRILCADTSEAPIHELRVDGWGFIHRAYRETAMNASEGALDSALAKDTFFHRMEHLRRGIAMVQFLLQRRLVG